MGHTKESFTQRKKCVLESAQKTIDNTRFKIGAMANLLGVSAESIRYYEHQGIIDAQRTENNTRYFDGYSPLKLLFAKQIQSTGCTIKEVVDYYESSFAGKRDLLANMEAQAFAQVRWYTHVTQAVHEMKRRAEKAYQEKRQVQICQSPELLFLPLIKDKENAIIGDKDIIRDWVDALPIPQIGFCLKDRYETEGFSPFNRDWGLLIEKQTQEDIQLPLGKTVTSIASSCCIRCYISDCGGFLMDQLWDVLREVSQTHHIIRPPFGFMADICAGKSPREFIAEVWIPIENS